ncbi:MAG: hypothetical protein VW475_13645, partial [Curvibacter sp.]
HVEQLDAGAPLPTLLPTAGTLLRQLRRDGQLQLALVDAPNDDWSALLVQTLRLDSTLRLGLSGIHADAWRTALQQQGVAATRLQLQGSEGKGLTLQPLR